MVIPRVTRKGKGIDRATIVMLWVDAVTRSIGDARTIRAHARTISKPRSFLCAATRLFAANVRVIATPLVIRGVWCRLANIKMTASPRMNKPWYPVRFGYARLQFLSKLPVLRFYLSDEKINDHEIVRSFLVSSVIPRFCDSLCPVILSSSFLLRMPFSSRLPIPSRTIRLFFIPRTIDRVLFFTALSLALCIALHRCLSDSAGCLAARDGLFQQGYWWWVCSSL
jgi:hypothetical protein